MTPEERARLMLSHHGGRAQQLAIDALVYAIKQRDEAAIAERGAILRALDELVGAADDALSPAERER